MFESLSYADFSDIIVVAIGINLTYVIINNKTEDKSQFAFFGFLSTVSNKILDWTSYIRSKSQKKEEATQTKLEYYINSGKLQKETTGAFKMLIRDLDVMITNISDAESKAKHHINSCCKADHLSKISFVCTIYGIYLLFFGVLERKCNTINVDSGILICNISILILIVHCLLWEKRTIQIDKKSKGLKLSALIRSTNAGLTWIGNTFAPRFLIYLILFFIIIIYSMFIIFGDNNPIDQWINEYKHINLFASLAICFSGFIIYTLVSLFFSIIFLIQFNTNINKFKIKEKVNEVEYKVENYKQELLTIDAEMKKPIAEDKFY